MKIGVLGNAESWYVADLQRAAKSFGHTCQRIDYQALTARVLSSGESVEADGLNLLDLDAVIIRTMPPGSLEQVVFRMDVLARLETAGITVLNPPRAIECAVDKYLATARLSAAGLTVPETIVCESSDQALEAFDALGRDVVVKPVFGAEGRGIVRVTDVEIARRVFRTLERIDAVLYVQRYIPNPGSDLRILLLGGRPIGAMRRYAGDGLRSNIACDGRAEAVVPNNAEVDLARRAADTTEAIFAGVDLLTGDDGKNYLLEVNGVPGWRALRRVSEIDVASRVIDWIAEQRSS